MFSATRPHSVALATNDSPAGLAAYILEKFAMWSGCEMTDTATCLESRFSKDDLLTNVMIYWATHSIASSMRFYYEQMHSPYRHVSARLVNLVTSRGVAWCLEGARADRKVRPRKVLQTMGVWEYTLQENVSNLGAQKSISAFSAGHFQ